MNEIPSMPDTPHPTALAFSRALEEHLSSSASSLYITKEQPINETECKLKNKEMIAKSKKNNRIIQTSYLLGWRNRNSLSSSYPVSMLIPSPSLSSSSSTTSSQSMKPMLTFSFTMTQIHETTSQKDKIDYGTGAYIWPASMVLLKYFEYQSHVNNNSNNKMKSKNDNATTTIHEENILFHKTVLDLGAGTGVTSIASALLGASIVVCTDGSKPVVQLAKDNVKRIQKEFQNEIRLFCKDDIDPHQADELFNVQVCEYQWGDVQQTDSILQMFSTTERNNISSSSIDLSYPDIILVSDCVLPKLFPIAPLVQTLYRCMGQNTRAYLSFEYRYFHKYDAKTKFWDLAEGLGLLLREIPRDQHHPVYQADDIELWEVRKHA